MGELQTFLGLGLGGGVLLLGEGGPLLLELGLAGGLLLAAGEGRARLGRGGLGVGDRHGGDQVARLLGERLGLGVVLLGECCVELVQRLGRGLQRLELEGDELVEQHVDSLVALLRQLGVEGQQALQFLVLERVGIVGRRLGVGLGAHRQAADGRLEQRLLAGRRQQELDEGLGARLVRRVGDDADIGRHQRRDRRIDELHREARALRGEGEEVDDDAVADLAGVDVLRHAERAVGDLPQVAGDLLRGAPAFGPALALQDGLDGEVRGARARRRRDRDVVEVGRLGEILPFLRRRQLVGLHVALVPHDAVAGRREADVEAVLVVDGIGADLLGDAGRLGLVGRQQLLGLQHFEGVGRRCPEQVDLVVGLGLLEEFHARVGVAVLDLERGARRRLLESFFSGSVTSLEKDVTTVTLPLARRPRRPPGRDGGRQEGDRNGTSAYPPTLGPSGRFDEAVQHLLRPGLLELDVELVAVDRDDAAVAELLVEHALADAESGLSPSTARRSSMVSSRQRVRARPMRVTPRLS